MTETRMFSTAEVATIFNMERSSINAAARKQRIKPTDIISASGRLGYAYRYNEAAEKLGGRVFSRKVTVTYEEVE